MPIQKSTFLRAIGVDENHEGFKVQEPTAEEFQHFLNHIRYHQDYKAKDFKKATISRLWTVLVHFIIRGLFEKHGGMDTLTKDYLYVVYNIYSGRSNVVHLPEVLWQDFQRFAIKWKVNEISSPRFWAWTIQELYKERSEPILVSKIPKEVCVTFKAIKHYRIPDQSSFRDFSCVQPNTTCPCLCWAHSGRGQSHRVRNQNQKVC